VAVVLVIPAAIIGLLLLDPDVLLNAISVGAAAVPATAAAIGILLLDLHLLAHLDMLTLAIVTAIAASSFVMRLVLLMSLRTAGIVVVVSRFRQRR
jgi:hypothetical protein